MDQSEFMSKARSEITRMRQLLGDILDSDDDAILSAPVIDDGGTMDQPNILQGARQRLATIEAEATAALIKRTQLEQQIQAQASATQSHVIGDFTRRSSVRGFFFAEPPNPVPGLLGSDTDAQLRAAYSEYSDVARRCAAAREDVKRIERRVADLRELMRCIEEEG